MPERNYFLYSMTAFWFILHLIMVILSWFVPFLLNWPIAIGIYVTLLLQFKVFGKCLMNQKHDLGEEDYKTFYSDLMERIGMQPDRRKVKRFIHGYFYWILMGVTVVWQIVLKKPHLLF